MSDFCLLNRYDFLNVILGLVRLNSIRNILTFYVPVSH